jgi:general secretion pathway protein I
MRSARDERGFTLIEVLVAFAIAVVLLVPLLHSFSTGLSSAARTDALSAATLIAQSTLESIGPETGLSAGGGFVRQEGRYRVATRIDRYDGDGVINGPILPVVPYAVAVTVSWQEGGEPHTIALRAVRLGPPPQTSETSP